MRGGISLIVDAPIKYDSLEKDNFKGFKSEFGFRMVKVIEEEV